VPELNREEVREVIYGSYRIIYKISNDIDILTVRHGRQLLDIGEIGR
jgi:plasmid stabilization system protein ParE